MKEILVEMRQDMLIEAYEDERREVLMRKDYDFFLDSIDDKIAEVVELIGYIKDQHNAYGWEFDVKEYDL